MGNEPTVGRGFKIDQNEIREQVFVRRPDIAPRHDRPVTILSAGREALTRILESRTQV